MLSDPKERALTFRQLQERGWPYSRAHTHRLVKAGKLSPPFKVYAGARINLYAADELESFLAACRSSNRGSN